MPESLHHKNEIVLKLKGVIKLFKINEILYHIYHFYFFLLETKFFHFTLFIFFVFRLRQYLNDFFFRFGITIAFKHAAHVFYYWHWYFKSHFIEHCSKGIEVLFKIFVHFTVFVCEKLNYFFSRFLNLLRKLGHVLRCHGDIFLKCS
jgi:hypothetical protein